MPCDPSGDPDGIAEEMFTDNPADLKGHRMDFIVEINHASDVPAESCKDMFVEYQFYLDEEVHRTPVCEGAASNPVFSYRKQHTVEYVSDGFLKYLDEKQLCFNVFGILNIAQKRAKKPRLNESSQLNSTAKSSGQNTSGGAANKSGSTTADNSLIGKEFELLNKEDLDNLDTQHMQRK